MFSQEGRNEHKKWSLGQKIVGILSIVVTLLTAATLLSGFQKEKIEEENFKVLESQLNEYEREYIKAHNENDMSYIESFYNVKSSLYDDTEDYINRKYNEQLKVDSVQIEIVSAPEKINNSNVYTIETNVEYKYDQNGRKGREKVKRENL